MLCSDFKKHCSFWLQGSNKMKHKRLFLDFFSDIPRKNSFSNILNCFITVVEVWETDVVTVSWGSRDFLLPLRNTGSFEHTSITHTTALPKRPKQLIMHRLYQQCSFPSNGPLIIDTRKLTEWGAWVRQKLIKTMMWHFWRPLNPINCCRVNAVT